MGSPLDGLAIIIPARYEASRFPGKLLQKVADRTILEWTWRRAVDAVGAGQIWIATDSDEIAATASQFGATCLRTGDHPTGTDRIAAAMTAITPEPTHIVNLQGDEPLIDPAVIKRLCRRLISSTDTIITCATPLKSAHQWRDPAQVKVVCDGEGRALYFSRAPIPATQSGWEPLQFKSLTTSVLGHIGLYGYPAAVLKRLLRLAPTPLEKQESLEQLRALETGIPIEVITVPERSVAVDTPDDLERVRQIMEKSGPGGENCQRST
jgi:3-deoxy-manno-octulosonate cytidylyltransferase (CMP-KDO synthetase)